MRDLARTYTETAIRAPVAVLEQGQSAAAQALLDRGWGRPVQALEVEKKGPPMDLSRLSDDELAQLEQLLGRAEVPSRD